jgi:hypothetical protein
VCLWYCKNYISRPNLRKIYYFVHRYCYLELVTISRWPSVGIFHDLRFLDRPSSSLGLCWLSYPGTRKIYLLMGIKFLLSLCTRLRKCHIVTTCSCHVCFLASKNFLTEDGGSMFLQKFLNHLPDYTILNPQDHNPSLHCGENMNPHTHKCS